MAALLAGECTPSEAARINSHLVNCPQCARELKDLRAVDNLLDLLEPEQAPAGLFESIMESVKTAPPDRYVAYRERDGNGPGESGRRKAPLPGLIKDLTAAAAVALTVFWIGTGWLTPLAPVAQEKISNAVLGYVRYTGAAVNRAQDSIALINYMDRFSLPANFNDREVIK